MDPVPPGFSSLNLALVVKTEPKLEPPDLDMDIRIPIPPLPKTLDQVPPSPIQSPLRSLSPNLADEHRRIHHFIISLIPQQLPNSNPNPNPNPNSSAALVPFAIADANAKKKWKPQARSSDLNRAHLVSEDDAVGMRDLVQRTRTHYESFRTLLLQEQRSRRRSRPDLAAATMMRDAGLWLNRDKRLVGHIPGVHIGDSFFYRMELCVLGLHGQVQAGIDFVPAGHSTNGQPIATSIVFFGGYEGNEDHGDFLVYSGHGGRKGRNGARHALHQKLEGGNLALEMSCNYGIEIRVIRGLRCKQSPTNVVYVYDGLYKVVKCWNEVGTSGFVVYKFKLVRLEGQPETGKLAHAML